MLEAGTAQYWVNNYQNPFGKKVSSIIDPLTAAKKSGTLSYDQLLQAQQDYQAAVDQYQRDMLTYEAQGGKHVNVIEQARQTFAPNDKTLRDSWFGTELQGLKPADTTEVTPPKMDDVTPGTTTQGAIDQAGVQQKKRSQAPTGRRGTILGGVLDQAGLGLSKTILGGY